MAAGIKDCARRYADVTGQSLSNSEAIVRNVVEVIKEELLEQGRVSFMGTFTLDVVQRKERNGVNPSTGASCIIPATKTLKVTVGKGFKEELNK